MQSLRQLGIGIIIAIVSVSLVLGGIMLALAESLPAPATPTQIPATLPQSFPSPTITASPMQSETPTTTQTATTLVTNTALNTPLIATSTPLAAISTPCTPPFGWIRIMAGGADTIYSFAQRYKTTAENLSAANCLLSAELPAGYALYVPPVPTVTVIACGPPLGWVKGHVVQRGDTLFRIALSYGITYPQLQRANCMGSSTTIYGGQRLWVPNVPARTPIPTTTTIPQFPTSTNTSPPVATPVTPSSTLPPVETSTVTVPASPTAISATEIPPYPSATSSTESPPSQ
jgi:LysM repeat protein